VAIEQSMADGKQIFGGRIDVTDLQLGVDQHDGRRQQIESGEGGWRDMSLGCHADVVSKKQAIIVGHVRANR
jgi:hypothetical protein